LTASLVAFACALSGLAFAPGLPLLAASLFAFAALNSVVDVAKNTQGLAFQRLMGRPVLSRLHAMHSLGGVLGAGGNAPGETPATAAARVSTLGYLGSFVGPALVGAWRACPACPWRWGCLPCWSWRRLSGRGRSGWQDRMSSWQAIGTTRDWRPLGTWNSSATS
jgi:hypothetical protein